MIMTKGNLKNTFISYLNVIKKNNFLFRIKRLNEEINQYKNIIFNNDSEYLVKKEV
jgi:hypothetical protein